MLYYIYTHNFKCPDDDLLSLLSLSAQYGLGVMHPSCFSFCSIFTCERIHAGRHAYCNGTPYSHCGTESQSVECMKIENGGQGTVSSIWVHRLIFSWLLSLAIWALLLLGLFTSFDREADFKLSYVLHPLRNHCSASVLSIRSSTAMYRVQSRAPHPLEYSDVWSSSLEVSRSLSPFYKIAQYKVMLWKSSSRLSKRTRAISWSSRWVNIGSNPHRITSACFATCEYATFQVNDFP